VCASAVLALAVAAAQATGTISGLVTDATEAALPAAMVEVASSANGLVRRSTTAPDGFYVIPLLPPDI
jgi:Carboxypeptidase regulatory-like domain